MTDHTLMPKRIERLLAEVEEARTTAQYWKAEHLAGNAEIERLRAENDRLTTQITAFKEGWMRVIDTEMVITHTGIAEPADDYSAAKTKLLRLIDWYVSMRTDPVMNGGWQLVPVEPTPKMLDSSIYPQSYLPLGGSNEANRLRRRAQKIYAAMLAVAPKPGGSDE